tara:strand:- start:3287 stop:3556 length:270 start_codon:yes stop_codon:yes gene_type:complete
MNEIRLSKEMKHMLLQLMAYGDTPERMATQIHNEFIDSLSTSGSDPMDYKLVKDTIRLLKHCDYYWGGSYVEEFTAEMKKLLPHLEVTV